VCVCVCVCVRARAHVCAYSCEVLRKSQMSDVLQLFIFVFIHFVRTIELMPSFLIMRQFFCIMRIFNCVFVANR
jgi:hypothetical protein